jgi:single-strand DNA-binding protein
MYEKIILVGRLGRDPEMRYTPNGKAVTSFSIATDRRGSDPEGKPTRETVWFRITVWEKQAENANTYLKKGSMVLVEGRLKADPNTGGPVLWTDKEGKTRATFEVTASTVRFLSTRTEGGGAEEAGEPSIGEEDVPF